MHFFNIIFVDKRYCQKINRLKNSNSFLNIFFYSLRFAYDYSIVYFRLGNDFYNYWSFSFLILDVLNRDYSLGTNRYSTQRQICFCMDGASFVVRCTTMNRWVQTKVISFPVLCSSTEGPKSAF